MPGRSKPERADVSAMGAAVNAKPLQRELLQGSSGGVIHAEILARCLCLPKNRIIHFM